MLTDLLLLIKNSMCKNYSSIKQTYDPFQKLKIRFPAPPITIKCQLKCKINSMNIFINTKEFVIFRYRYRYRILVYRKSPKGLNVFFFTSRRHEGNAINKCAQIKNLVLF